MRRELQSQRRTRRYGRCMIEVGGRKLVTHIGPSFLVVVGRVLEHSEGGGTPGRYLLNVQA